MSLSASIFRAYDIRGIAHDTLTTEDICLIGKALGSLVLKRGEHQMVIARDGRLSGSDLHQALSEGILSTGCNVIDIGMVTSPVLYYACAVLKEHSGAMVTGSHNPSEYNGLKMVVQGMPLAEVGIQTLYQTILAKDFTIGEGNASELNIVDQYIQYITRHIHLDSPPKIVIDAGNGVAGAIAPKLFRALGCEVIELFCDVDGRFPHHEPDPSQPHNLSTLIQSVKKHHAGLGLAFDGDGDRLGIVTSKGQIIWPDRLLMLFAKKILETQNDATIIYDVKCTNHLKTLIESLGGHALMWKTGHSLIKAKLIETKAQLAGEMSGHFFFNDRWFGFDDAIYAGARLLEILNDYSSIDEAFDSIPDSVNTPELKIAIPEEEKFELMRKLIDHAQFEEAHDVTTIDGLRVNFSNGWGLVRASNTTPYLTLRFEAINEVFLKNIQAIFKEWMLSVKPDLVGIPF